MRFLKQSTATTVILGPTLDEVDFITPITSLTHAGIVAGLIKGTANTAITVTASGSSNDLVHIVAGLHSLELTTTDTNTLGHLRIHLSDADSFMPVAEDFHVLSANVFDSLFGSGDNLQVDAVEVSGDTTAADNLELQYDTTGLSGDNFPAAQHQVQDLAVTGSAIHTSAESYVLTTGTQSANTVTAVVSLDGTNHEHTDVGNAMDLYYQFDVSADGVATSATLKGYLNSNNDDLEVYAWNWGGSAWDRIGTLNGQNAASNGEHDYILFVAHTGTGTDNGKVRIRFTDGAFTLSSATLAIDQIFVSYAVVRQTVGYALGRIWINTGLSNTNTVDFIDGTADNPVSTIGAAKTLSASLGIVDFHVVNGSTITLAATTNKESYFGDNWTLALGGQEIGGSHFEGATITGTSTSSSLEVSFDGCEFGSTCTVERGHFDFCGFFGTLTLGLAADYNFHNCYGKGDTAPIFNKTADQAIVMELVNYRGDMTISGIQSGDTYEIDGVLRTTTLNGTSGTVHFHGLYQTIINNRSPDAGTLEFDGAIKTADAADTLADTVEVANLPRGAGKKGLT